MEIQKYLKSGKTLEDLETEYGISNVRHPTLSLVLLNYSQIDSPKTHQITRECRNLVLELDTWNCVSRSFDRFFNLNEVTEITGLFNWDDFVAWDKEDGSLCSLFWYKDNWHFTTRASWGNGLIQETGFTWEELFRNTFGPKHDLLDTNKSYQFELCSIYNRVVKIYPFPTLFLLGITEGCDNSLIGGKLTTHVNTIVETAVKLGVDYPKLTYKWTHNHINALDELDEGFVLLDSNGLRIKVKSKQYLLYHKAKNNGVLNNERILEAILDNNHEEFLAVFPEFKEKFEKIQNSLSELKIKVEEAYEKYKDIENQKEFALALAQRMPPLAWVLFEARRHSLTIDEVFSSPRYVEKIKKGILELI